jgi:hypothetical protein
LVLTHVFFGHLGNILKRESYVDTVIGSGHWYITRLRDGKQVESTDVAVSKDGKTMNATGRGTDAKRKPYESLQVFDRQ